MQEEQFPLPIYPRLDVPPDQAQMKFDQVNENNPAYLVQISNDDGELIVGVRPDGTVEYGEGTISEDDAADRFWSAVAAATQSLPSRGVSKDKTFQQDLAGVINRHSMENGSNTPDFMLSNMLMDTLQVWNKHLSNREAWYGRPRPGETGSFGRSELDEFEEMKTTLERVKNRLTEVVGRHVDLSIDRNDLFSSPMVNAKQILDLLEPDGMWSYSFEDSRQGLGMASKTSNPELTDDDV